LNRELTRRVDRLEDYLSVGSLRRPILIWAEEGQDRASIEAKAKARGFVDGDALYVVSWRGTRQPPPRALICMASARSRPIGPTNRQIDAFKASVAIVEEASPRFVQMPEG
jgi:hypothetical protein